MKKLSTICISSVAFRNLKLVWNLFCAWTNKSLVARVVDAVDNIIDQLLYNPWPSQLFWNDTLSSSGHWQFPVVPEVSCESA